MMISLFNYYYYYYYNSNKRRRRGGEEMKMLAREKKEEEQEMSVIDPSIYLSIYLLFVVMVVEEAMERDGKKRARSSHATLERYEL